MLIKKISFIDKVMDIYKGTVDVGVEFKDGYAYTIVVSKPADLLENMNQEKTNFIRPSTLMIVVKKLTKEIVTEVIQVYAEKNNWYWLKLHQFADDIDISVLNKLVAESRKKWELDDLE